MSQVDAFMYIIFPSEDIPYPGNITHITGRHGCVLHICSYAKFHVHVWFMEEPL